MAKSKGSNDSKRSGKKKNKKKSNKSASAASVDAFLPIPTETHDVPNPFVGRELGCGGKTYEVIKSILMTLTFVPVRWILALFTVLLMVLFSWLSVVGLSAEERTRPLSACRRVWTYPARFFCRATMFIFGFWWISESGRPDDRARVLAIANHSSFVDPAFFMWRFWPAGVSAAENERFCFVGSIVRSSQAILIDRGDPESRRAGKAAIRERALEDGWSKIMIFVEGTCTNREALIQFKAGAFAAGVPVQPITVDYPSWFFDHAWLAPGPSPVFLLYRLSCQVFNRMKVTYHPVYFPNDDEKADAILYAHNVRAQIAAATGKPVTNHAYEDCRLQHYAIKKRFPAEKAVVEYGHIHELYEMDLDAIRAKLDVFATSSPNTQRTGEMTIDDFAQALQLTANSEPVRNLFRMFDRDDNGVITFREYLVGLAVMNDLSSREDTIEYAFSLFDEDGSGSIEYDAFHRLLSLVFPNLPSEFSRGLFEAVDANDDGLVDFDEFKAYAGEHPEYVKMFLDWQAGNEVISLDSGSALLSPRAGGRRAFGTNSNSASGSYSGSGSGSRSRSAPGSYSAAHSSS